MKTSWLSRAAGLSLALALAGCAGYRSIARDRSLYGRLGGKAGVQGLVDDLIDTAASDARIAFFFAGADLPKLKAVVSLHLCRVTGGSCAYPGKNMIAAHKGMNVRSGDFNAFVEDLQKAMAKREIPLDAQNELLAILGPMRREILGR